MRPRFHFSLSSLIGCLSLVALLATAGRSSYGQDAYQLKVVTDRSDAIYESGATARYLVTFTKGEEPVTAGEVSCAVDVFITEFPPAGEFAKGKLELDSKDVVSATLPTPGFLRCRVTYLTPGKKRLQATAAAAFSPDKIQPSLPVPDDFDEFWTAEKAIREQLQATSRKQ